MTYGQHTTDEMAELWLQVVPRNAAGPAPGWRAPSTRTVVREEIVGVEKRLETDPDNAALHDDVALLHAEAGHLDRTVEHLPRRSGSSRIPPPRTTTSATPCSGRGGAPRRSTISGQALALSPTMRSRTTRLGVAVFTEGKVGEAIEHYRRALALDPRNADAHHHLAVALRSLGRLAEAIPHYRQVLADRSGPTGRQDGAGGRRAAARGRTRRPLTRLVRSVLRRQ